LALSHIFIIYYTATRGTILGLLGGLLIVAVLSIVNKPTRLSSGEENKSVRKTGIAILLGLLVLVGGFWTMRNTDFVTKSPVLSRFSSLTTAELKTQGRYFVWPIAFEGFKERPILGWGQENFTYIFQKHYVPEMFHLEPWFDRAHNIFLDWLVAGGVLGLLAYLSLYGAMLLLIWRPLGKDEPINHAPGLLENGLSYTEKSILTGLIAAYFFHNLFVFDHLISYILFFSLLAYIHSRSLDEMPPSAHGQKGNSRSATSHPALMRIALPTVGVLLVLSLYFVNIKPLTGNISLIEALKSLQTPGEMELVHGYFQKAHESSSLGRPEVIEHMASNSITLLTSDIPIEEREAFYLFAKESVLAQSQHKAQEKEARYQLMAGSFLSSVGSLDEALVFLERAKVLIPGKPQVYLEITNVFLHKDDYDSAINTLMYLGEISPAHREYVDRYIKQIQEDS
jgi:tetratricopeptide (TPR) repeat protein